MKDNSEGTVRIIAQRISRPRPEHDCTAGFYERNSQSARLG